MKKLFLIIIVLCITVSLQAQVSKTVNVTPGGLSLALTATEKTTVTNLTVTGTIDARDFKTMRDSLTVLSVVDLSGVTTAAYTGTEGTYDSSSINYLANEIPPLAIGFNYYYPPIGKISLTSFIFPSSVESIGASAFRFSGLTSVTIPSSVKSIGVGAFADCQSLSSFTISEGTTSIGDWAFGQCSSLISVTIPSTVTSIGDNIFFNCVKLSSVILPEGVTSIGESAFSYCEALTSINIPSKVISIGYYAFTGCNSLTSVIIPSSVKSISERAFYQCEKLSSVSISNGVTSIGASTFSKCVSLTSVIIPPSVKSIGESAFESCKKLSSATISEGVTSIGKSAFSYCESLKSIIIPSSVKSIENNTFYYCINLNSATISKGVTSIGKSAFYYCYALNSVTIPSSVTSIGNEAFYDCGKLNSVNIPEGVTSIGTSAFEQCQSLTAIIIPSSVQTIGMRSFYQCSRLSQLTISEGVSSIGESAFSFCESLFSVTIPSSVTSIGQSAFNGCSALASINVNFSIPFDLSLSADVFKTVNKTTCKLYVPYGTKNLYAAAAVWKDFTNIIESSSGFNLSSNSGTLAAEEGSKLSVEIKANTAWTASSNESWLTVTPTSGVGNDVLVITATAYPIARKANITVSSAGVASQIIKVTQVTKSLTMNVTPGELSAALAEYEKGTLIELKLTGSIDASDFIIMRDSMPNLAIVDLSEVNITGYCGFKGNEWICYPANEIPPSAFFNKISLTSFTYPLSVTSIGQSAFNGYSALASIKAMSEIPIDLTSSPDVFFGVNKTTCKLYVPAGTKSLYAAANQWKDFRIIEEFSVNVSDLINTAEIIVFPNPVTDGFLISGLKGISTLSIFDINGKLLLTKEIDNDEYISVSSLPQGLYIVRIKTDAGTFEKKLVKK